MQATTAPSAPQATIAPVVPGTSLTAAPSAEVLLPGIPRTAADVVGLRARREELSNQLISASGRRSSLSRQLAGKEGLDRAGIESHIAVLDKRIMQLESDIAETGRQLTMTPGTLVASAQAARQVYGMNPDAIAAMSVFFTVFVLGPLAFGAARLMWKRAGRAAPPPAISGDAARRLERLEQGMDAIAIEIERVSEGQRFVTRLLSEAHTNAPLAIPTTVGSEIEERSASASPPIR
jgi:hypothetical protein